MALFNYTGAPYVATPHPPTTPYFQPPQPFPPFHPPQGSYSYPRPQKQFLAEELPDNSPYLHPPNPNVPQPSGLKGPQAHNQQKSKNGQPPPLQPITFTKVPVDDGSKTSVHAIIDYDYEEEVSQIGHIPVTPIQGPIFIKNGHVPVVPLYSHPVLHNGTFVQIPVSLFYQFTIPV
ncbi:hypothetical protein JTB14_024937 [Gonioctena quinquepunctata]|nr:hypothetical protein JTB14_024937 [Gonioctena quinquepunctata]